ncbi:unnamed protein product [Porites lobata]|uniref:Uncharacterized protein n=1 Tax=Porites lobata TaxID=104759 RepID=A0ABN8NSN2_9CNID|nr:unnamed protein product [Porites lobata]
MRIAWCQAFLGVAFIALLNRSKLKVSCETEILLDRNQNSSWYWLTRLEFGPWSGWSRGGESEGYSVCDLSETANNHTNSWLVSEYIDLQGANEVHLKLLFTIRQCPSVFLYCKQAFTVFKLQTNGPEIGGITKKDVLTGKFSHVQTVNATHVWTPGAVPRMNQANINVAVNGRGIYLAFQDTGACLSLASVVVSYTYCPSVIKHGVLFNKTSAPQSSLHNVTVKGTCSSGASPYPSNSLLTATCLSTGQWVKDDKITCLCAAGYELAGDTCAECEAGYYKDSVGNGQCVTCPSSSLSTPGQGSCSCEKGFYRAPHDLTNDSCTAPPSEPRNINITVVADSIVLVTWSRPVSDGGREDVKYHVRCSACSNTGSCSENCSGVQFWPSQIDLTTTQVTISKLKSSMLYNITVISKNGVSDQAGISSLKSLHRTFSLNVGMATNPPSTSTIKTVESHLNLTKADGTTAPGQGTASANVAAAVGISVSVTFILCFIVAAIIIFLMMKSFSRKHVKQQSEENSVTQLLDISREGSPVKRIRSMTATTELSECDSKPDLQDEKQDTVPAINIYDANSNSKPNPLKNSVWFPSKRFSLSTNPSVLKESGSKAELQSESNPDSETNSRPNSSTSIEWLPLKRKSGLPALNWKNPRAISPVLIPHQEIRRKKSAPPLDLGDTASSNTLSPRKPPEGSEMHKTDRSPSVNSWFPAEEIQFNV